MPPATNEFTVNDRTYRPPDRPVAVICIDGCADEYLDTSLARGRMPRLARLLEEGAFRAMARDYDQDGDTDIAAVSYFPDYVKSPRESFVYYENKGKNQFAANTFRNCISGRWLTMDAGDLDGDGDIDLALGNYAYGPTSVPSFLMEAWKSSGPPVLILENMLNP